jgi:hypothetical protein
MERDTNRLASLIDMHDPASVLAEVKTIVTDIHPDFDVTGLERVFAMIEALYRGDYPGYRRCNTDFHDLQHTTDCLLAMARLIHGAVLHGERFTPEQIEPGLLAALFHDCGYVQTDTDTTGTGAKYTKTHIRRGIELMRDYFTEQHFPHTYARDAAAMIRCTGLGIDIAGIDFSSRSIEVLGKMLGSADLLGQMADRTYLEKLLFLYHEFTEGGIPGFDDEVTLLAKTLDFYAVTRERLSTTLDGHDRHLVLHFRRRWHLDKDLYAVAIQRNRDYLRFILDNHLAEHRAFLRRGDVVRRLGNKGL